MATPGTSKQVSSIYDVVIEYDAITKDQIYQLLKDDTYFCNEANINFRCIRHRLRQINGNRWLSNDECRLITFVLYERQQVKVHMTQESMSSIDAKEILVFTSYSKDYWPGILCESVNKKYCEAKGYKWESFVVPYLEMLEMISPRKHCTWFKVLLILQYLNKQDFPYKYIIWIDADAVVINHSIRIEDLISRGKFLDLIIAEDMNPGNIINAGVMIIKVSHWSRVLWEEVWKCPKYHDVYFYEQSSLIHKLKSRLENLITYKPFHTFLPDAKQDDKIFGNVAILPHYALNTNRGCEYISYSVKPNIFELFHKLLPNESNNNLSIAEMARELSKFAEKKMESFTSNLPEVTVLSTNSETFNISEVHYPKFIFHPAGKKDKVTFILTMLERHGIVVSPEFFELEQFILHRYR